MLHLQNILFFSSRKTDTLQCLCCMIICVIFGLRCHYILQNILSFASRWAAMGSNVAVLLHRGRVRERDREHASCTLASAVTAATGPTLCTSHGFSSGTTGAVYYATCCHNVPHRIRPRHCITLPHAAVTKSQDSVASWGFGWRVCRRVCHANPKCQRYRRAMNPSSMSHANIKEVIWQNQIWDDASQGQINSRHMCNQLHGIHAWSELSTNICDQLALVPCCFFFFSQLTVKLFTLFNIDVSL